MSLTVNEVEEAIKDAQEIIRQFEFKIDKMAKLARCGCSSGVER